MRSVVRTVAHMCLAWVLYLWVALSSASAQSAPREVVIGLYVNDVQIVDLAAHSFAADFYLWFRWPAGDPDPTQTFEFMNDFEPYKSASSPLYDAPKPQPDGTLYQLYRYQGYFSSKFPVRRYPFDHQKLSITIEDGDAGIQDLVYVPDNDAFTLSQRITLPGYDIADHMLRFRVIPYATAFGDLAQSNTLAYSRADFVIEIKRPWLAASVKLLVPVILIIFGTTFSLFVDPAHIEARLGFSITTLLTLAALQLTMKSGLPYVGYLTLLDQIFLVSYIYILAILGHIVAATRFDDVGHIRGDDTQLQKLITGGPRLALLGNGLYIVAVLALIGVNLL